MGISPEQAQRLLDGECLLLLGTQLTQYVHPPPAIQNVDLDCFTDFRLAPSGAATWLYVLHGVKVLALLPPTAHNRRLFLTWAAATRANQPKENVVVDMFLAKYAENAVKVEVKASQALVIPAGWFYASTTLSDTLAVGCFFWHPYALADYARSQQLEMQLRLRSARFCLQARPLLWYAAAYFASFIRPKVGLPEFKLRPAKPTGSVGAHGGRSVSEASMSQRPSPHIRGQQAPALMGSSSKQQPRTPPLLTNSSQDAGSFPAATLSSPAVRPRARQDAMDALCLGEAAVPLLRAAQHTPGVATVAAARQSVSSERHGAGSGTKRRRLTAGPPSRASSPGPGDGQPAAGHAASVSTVGTPRSISRGGFIAAATAQRQRQQSMSGTALVKYEQQQQAPAPAQGYGRAAAEDDDDGECHTSPVRKPEVNPDGQAADDVDWGLGYVAGCCLQPRLQDRLVAETGVIRGSGVQQPLLASGSSAAAAGGGEQTMPKHITGLKIKVPGKSMPLYSPVIQGLKGQAAPAAAAAAAKAPGIPGIKLKFKLASPSPKLMAAPAAGAGNPPVDGAGDEQRPRSSGPTLVLQPLLAPVAVQGRPQQQQQQDEHRHAQAPTQGPTAGNSLGFVAGASRAADAVAGDDSSLAAGRALRLQQNTVLLQSGLAAGLAGARDTPSPSKQLLQLRTWGPSSTAKPPKQQGAALQQQQQAGTSASAPQLAPAVRGDRVSQQLQPESQDMLSPFLGGVDSLPPPSAAAALPAGCNDLAVASKLATDAAAADSCEQPLMQPEKDASLSEEELRSDPSLIHWSRPAAASATLAGQCQALSVSQPLMPQPLPAAAAIVELPDVPGNLTTLAPVEPPEGTPGLDAPGGCGPSLDCVAAAAAGESAGQLVVAADLTRQRLSAWEIAELPVLVEFLQEQVAEKSVCEGPPNMAPDPEWLIQQLSEAVAEAVRKEREQMQQQGIAAGVGGAVQQQPAMGTVGLPGAVTAAAAAAAVADCGPLVVSPFAPDEMPAGLADAIRVGQQLLRETGTAVALGVHDATTEVVGETDPLGISVGAAGSLDNRSGGSYGTAAMARWGGLGGGAAAAAGGGTASNRKRPAPAGSAQAASAATRGAQQLKKQKQDKLLKGLGIARR
eukprot:gene8402-8586_t